MLVTKEIIESFIRNEITNDLIEAPKCSAEKKKFLISSIFTNDSEKKMAIWKNSGRFRCYKTGYDGNFITLVMKVKNLNLQEAKYYILKNYLNNDLKLLLTNKENYFKRNDLEDFNIISFPDYFEKINEKHKEYIEYLNKREIDWRELNLFINPKEKRIVFPIYRNNNLVYYTQRAIDNNKLRWKDASVGNKEGLFFQKEKTEIVYLCEGIFDSLKIRGGIALLGSHVSEKTVKEILNQNPYKIVIVMDNDPQGFKSQILLFIALRKLNFKNIYFFDWSKFNEKDLGEIPKYKLENIESLIYKADNKGLMKWILENMKKIDENYRKQIKTQIRNLF